MQDYIQPEITVKIGHLETHGDAIRKISVELHKFGIEIKIKSIDEESTEYVFDILK